MSIQTVFVFPNGNVAVTNEFGNQMPEYQGKFGDIFAKIMQALADKQLSVDTGCMIIEVVGDK